MAVVEGCPAFSEGCPFVGVKPSDFPDLMQSIGVGNSPLAAECPAFKDACPFKECDSVEALYNKMSEMPATHRVGEESKAAKVVEQTLRKVHEVSAAKKAEGVGECPVFATSCPFKTVTSDGEPLVQQLDKVVFTNWELDQPEVSPASAEKQADEPLSKHLKAGTKAVHRAAENVRFVRDFLKGAVPKDSYLELLKGLYHVYSTMEQALDGLPKNLQHVDFDVLRRTQTLEADIRNHAGLAEGAPLDVGPPSPAAKMYIDRMKNLVKEDPYLLLAHAYTRYLGDLSGGQILARSAIKAYNLPADGAGVAFYFFEKVGTSPKELKDFKRSYRASLDALRLSSTQADALVEESNWAFCMNMLLFEERDVAAGHLDRIRTLDEVDGLVKESKSALDFQKAYGGKAPGGVCPFLPPPEQRGKPGGMCPWPFIWMHDPKVALITHPIKNLGGALFLVGLARAAWYHPRRVGLGLLATGAILPLLKPKKKQDGGGDGGHH